jgi:4-hydroxy-tetrahydrodipicolinate reductase
MLKLAILGADGRMGRALRAAIAEAPDLSLSGAIERDGSPSLEAKVGPLSITSDLAVGLAGADVLIDFTAPEATLAALDRAPAFGVKAAIIGSTGFSSAQDAAIAAAAQTMAIVKSGNFSLGVNLLAGLVRQAAAKLGPEWDIEILEAHHRAKVDAPSGTALLLGDAAAEGRGRRLSDLRLAPREGVTGPRPGGGIGFAVVRGGSIVGDHEVLFAGAAETIRLSHHAADRALFAQGALAAARWAAGRPPGLYAMRDVLGL